MNRSLRLSAVQPRYILACILLIQAILGTAYALSSPLWNDHEPDYYTVVRFVVDHGRLPTEADYPAHDAEIRQATQPPLYFLLAYPVVALLDDGQAVPPGAQPTMICVGDGKVNDTMTEYPLTADYIPPVSGAVAAGYALRLLNVLLGMAAVALTYAAGRTLFPSRPAIALIAAALLAFEGNTLLLSSEISNDTLLIALSAANVLICAHLARRMTPRLILLLLVTVGLALLTRLPGWALLAFDIPFVLLVSLIQPRAPLSTRIRRVLIPVGVLALAGAAVIAFNLITYGSVLGRYNSLADVISHTLLNFRLPWVIIAGVANLTYTSYLEPLALLTPRAIIATAYGAVLVVGVLASVALLIIAVYRRRWSMVGALLILFGTAGVAVLLVVFRNALAATAENTTLYNTGVLYAPIRYYAPGLPAAALLLGAGLASLIPARFGERLQSLPGIAVAGGWLTVSILGAALMIANRPAAQILSPAEFAALPGLSIVQGNQPPDMPKVLAYRLNERPADGFVDLTLYMTTDSSLPLNYYAQVEIVGGSGQRPPPCEFIPARGAYPTTLWQPDQIVAATAAIPNCDDTLALPAELALRWVGAEQDGSVAAQQDPPLTLASLSQPLVRAPSCPEKLGMIAGQYQVVKFNSPPVVHSGETYLPSLNWIVFDPVAEAAERVYTFTHEQTGTRYTCTGSVAPQVYDVRVWQHGQEVFFDVCTMKFPADAPPGVYRVAVGITSADQQYLAASGADGVPLPDGLIPVGEVELVS